jgi:carbon storage regulator
MLILTRKVGQRVMIGDDIIVEVVGVEKNEIRLGIIAPENVPVHREEVYWRAKGEE